MGRKYSIAVDWQLGDIFTLRTGFPITVANGSDQPPYNSGVDPNLANRDPQLWYDLAP